VSICFNNQHLRGELFERIHDLYRWNFYSNKQASMIVRLLVNVELHRSVSTVDMLSVKYDPVIVGFVERKKHGILTVC
jgi:hypothetical protein